MESAATVDCPEVSDTKVMQPARPRAPIELRVALMFTGVFVFGLLCGFPINLPNEASLRFAQYHYFAPLMLAFALQLPVAWLSFRRNRTDPYLLLKLLPFLMLVILVHFNFKAWMPLVNSRCYDDAYQRLDEIFWPLVTGFSWLRETIAEVLPFNPDRLYHSLFVAMFFAAFSAHALLDTPVRQRRLVLGVCLILLIGGICYWIAPAVGPFLHRQGVNEYSTGAQGHMLGLFSFLVQTGEIPPGYFTAPLAAMPSLHVAHALFFTLFAAQSLRWLYWLFLPVLGWIILESVASGWHYLADLPVGAGLAVLCLYLTRVLVPEKLPAESKAVEADTLAPDVQLCAE